MFQVSAGLRPEPRGNSRRNIFVLRHKYFCGRVNMLNVSNAGYVRPFPLLPDTFKPKLCVETV